MKKFLAVSLLALGLAACATKAPDASRITFVPADRLLTHQAKIEGGGEIVVTRDVGMVGGGCKMAFLIDGAAAGQINRAERATFYVEAGEHILGTEYVSSKGLCSLGNKSQTRTEISAMFKPNETKRYRIGVDESDITRIAPTTL